MGMNMTELDLELQNRLYEWDPSFDLTGEQAERLRIFYENLIQWNEVMNLTAITEIHEVYEKHFLDSMSIIHLIDRKTLEQKNGSLRLIDVGTGAGFPGLVLAIAFPNLQITLMDSLNKRIGFLNDTVQKMDLKNVVCIHARAEELAKNKDHREKYDLAVSRAVANIATLSEYCLPFVKVGGSFVAYKSEKAEEELKAAGRAMEILGGELKTMKEFKLPGTEYSRTLMKIDKVRATDKKYPRKAGTPAKDPLN